MKFMQKNVMLPLAAGFLLAGGVVTHNIVKTAQNEREARESRIEQLIEEDAKEREKDYANIVLHADTIEMNEALRAYNNIDTSSLNSRYRQYQSKLEELNYDIEQVYRAKIAERDHFVEQNKALVEEYKNANKLKKAASGENIATDVKHFNSDSFSRLTGADYASERINEVINGLPPSARDYAEGLVE